MVLLRQVLGLLLLVPLVGTEAATAQGSVDTLPAGRVVRLKTASEVIEGRLAHPLPMNGGTAQICAWDPGPCSGKGIRLALTGGLVFAGLGAILGTGIGEWVPLR